MKVLVLPSYFYPFPGSTSTNGKYCIDQAIFLKKHNIDVEILANIELSWRAEKLKLFKYEPKMFWKIESGVKVYRYFFWRIPFLHKQNVKRWIKKTVRLFEEYCEQNGKPDIIHAHSSMWAGYAASLIKKKYGIAYVVTEHNGLFGEKIIAPPELRFLSWYHKYIKCAFVNSNYILPVSDLMIAKIKNYTLPDNKIRVVSNVYNQLFEFKRREKHFDKIVFFAISSFSFSKGYDILLKAFELAVKTRRNIELRIAGAGFENQIFQHLLAETECKNNIVLLGKISPLVLRDELWNANVFVMASRVEAQPIAILEAMATGLPIICTEIISENVVSGNIGFRVPVEDVEGLANAMIKMIGNIAQFDNFMISECAKKIAGENVFIKNIVSTYTEVLQLSKD